MGSLNILPKKFKEIKLAKFGMKKYSLDPLAPNVHDLEKRNY